MTTLQRNYRPRSIAAVPTAKLVATAFLGASYPRRQEACKVRDILQGKGIAVMARWLDRKGQHGYTKGLHPAHIEQSIEDMADVQRSQCAVFLTGDQLTRGGRHAELGAAIAYGKTIYLLGNREHVHHLNPLVHQCAGVAELVELITIMAAASKGAAVASGQ